MEVIAEIESTRLKLAVAITAWTRGTGGDIEEQLDSLSAKLESLDAKLAKLQQRLPKRSVKNE